MAEPTSKTTRSKRGMRRSHNRVSSPTTFNCPSCGALARPHRACGECGFYRNREVIQPKI